MENGAPPITSFTPPTHPVGNSQGRIARPNAPANSPVTPGAQMTPDPGTYDAAKRALAAASDAAIAYGDQAEATRRQDTISAALGRPAATAPFPNAGPAHTQNQERYGSLSGLPAPQSQVQTYPEPNPQENIGTKNAISKASQKLAWRLAQSDADLESGAGLTPPLNTEDGVYPLSN